MSCASFTTHYTDLFVDSMCFGFIYSCYTCHISCVSFRVPFALASTFRPEFTEYGKRKRNDPHTHTHTHTLNKYWFLTVSSTAAAFLFAPFCCWKEQANKVRPLLRHRGNEEARTLGKGEGGRVSPSRLHKECWTIRGRFLLLLLLEEGIEGTWKSAIDANTWKACMGQELV